MESKKIFKDKLKFKKAEWVNLYTEETPVFYYIIKGTADYGEKKDDDFFLREVVGPRDICGAVAFFAPQSACYGLQVHEDLELIPIHAGNLVLFCQELPSAVVRVMNQLSQGIRQFNDMYLMKKESLYQDIQDSFKPVDVIEEEEGVFLKNTNTYPMLLPEAHKNYLYSVSKTCPVCEETFKTQQMRYSKVRNLGVKEDLRTLFQDMDEVWYALITCPTCSYTNFNSTFHLLRAVYHEPVKNQLLNIPFYHAPSFKTSINDVLNQYNHFIRILPAMGNSAMARAKAWQSMMWLFQDVEDAVAAGIAKEVYVRYLMEAWYAASEAMDAETEGMLTYKLAYATYESGNEDEAYRLFLKTKQIKGISGILKKRVEDRLFEISEKRRSLK